MARSFSIAFVCTGNRFRSPLARAFVERLTLGLPIEVVTAGTLEIEGAPVLSEAQELGTWCGVDLSGHRSLPLSKLPLGDLDLVLGFEEQHVRRAVVDAGAGEVGNLGLHPGPSARIDTKPGVHDDSGAACALAIDEELQSSGVGIV